MSVVYGGNKGHGGYVCTALPSNAGAQSCLYAPRLNSDRAVVEAVGVGRGERVLGLLHFGAPAREPAPREREPVETYVEFLA